MKKLIILLLVLITSISYINAVDQRYKCLGNAVTTNVVRYIFNNLKGE